MRKASERKALKRENSAMNRVKTILTFSILFGAGYLSAANARQTTGVVGSPSATTTIDGNQLPPPRVSKQKRNELSAPQSRRHQTES
jgi:hypothetical protein